MEQGLRFAAIDIGSNAMRLLFSRVIVKENEPPYFIKESLLQISLLTLNTICEKYERVYFL